MTDYKLNGKVYEITLENGKVVKVDKTWVENSVKKLETDVEDVLLMWLEDNDYLVNEELEELDTQAKANKPKNVVKSTTERKKVVDFTTFLGLFAFACVSSSSSSSFTR